MEGLVKGTLRKRLFRYAHVKKLKQSVVQHLSEVKTAGFGMQMLGKASVFLECFMTGEPINYMRQKIKWDFKVTAIDKQVWFGHYC